MSSKALASWFGAAPNSESPAGPEATFIEPGIRVKAADSPRFAFLAQFSTSNY